MRAVFAGRVGHYLLLAAVVVAVTQPGLGAPALFDDDEGVNAEAAREMGEVGTWIVPTFNYELRTAKPVLLYWLQRASYSAFGVSEWAARFPATILALGTVLLVYELARKMFGAAVGVQAGIVLASAVTFCQLAHAATPDAPLIFFSVLTLYLFWVGFDRTGWASLVPAAAACGFAVLTKGPVGLAMPGLVVATYLLWTRELHRLWDRRFLWAWIVFLAVAAPWYVLVTTETRGEYARAFFVHENMNRFLAPMEGHRGPVVYYLGAVIAFFVPWSLFLGGTGWYAVAAARQPVAAVPAAGPVRAYRFLLCWVASYLVFFSLAATKLPNYIAPLYPALAILTAAFLVNWRQGILQPARWYMPAVAASLAVVGGLVTGGLLVAGGAVPIPVQRLRTLPGLENWAFLGGIPILGAAGFAWRLARHDRVGALRAVSLSTVLFVGLLAAGIPRTLDRYNAPRDLVRTSGAADDTRDVRLASLDFTVPSVTFYAHREVQRLATPAAAAEFLALPRPAFLFVPEPAWTRVEPLCEGPYRIAARKYDLQRNCDVLVVTNDYAKPVVNAAR
ncbi:MAG TPA: glycosyltransferase family 39 protein [Fimbriiglobus sp.]|jgi:4-amino-4-deoxy-L-arabinose transferase-like glycosyltransferase